MVLAAQKTFLSFVIITTCLISLPRSYADNDIPNSRDVRIGDVFKFPILEVRPTQEAVGLAAVEEKAEEMKDLSEKKLKKYLEKEMIPVIFAPDGHFYQIDHHHLARAAHDAGRTNAYYELKEDFSDLKDMDAFWAKMKERHWVREFDHLGKRIKIPGGLVKTITALVDDPYRSLAWFVRKAGGYVKTDAEFVEFLWADFFRTRIVLENSKSGFQKATQAAVKLALSDEAKAAGLPGFLTPFERCKHWLSAFVE